MKWKWSDIGIGQIVRIVITDFKNSVPYVRNQYLLMDAIVEFDDGPRPLQLSLPLEKLVGAIVRRPLKEQLIIKYKPAMVEIVKGNMGKIIINSIKEYQLDTTEQ